MLEKTVLEKHEQHDLNSHPKRNTSGNFDPYDSSHPDYSEKLEDVTERAMFQYKFRKKIELGMPNPSEPAEYQRAMAENNRRLRQFFRGDRSFDIASYMGSDVFYERQRLGEERLLRKIVRDMNNRINEEFIKNVKEIKITNYALDKSKYIAQRVSELAKHVGKGEHYEIGMYMINNQSEVNKGEVITRDVYIGQEQIDESDHCDVTPLGKIRSFREVKSIDNRIIGWAHSHGNHNTFFSDEDDNTLRDILNKWGIKKTLDCEGLFLSGTSVEYFTAFVVNDRASEPAYRIVANKPIYYIKDGIVKCKKEFIDLERTVLSNENYRNKWPIPHIISNGSYTLDRDRIDREIIDRVIFADGTRLRDCYTDKQSNLNVNAPVYDDKPPIIVSDKKKDETDLTDRVNKLEDIHLSLKAEHELLLQDYKKLQEKVAYLETQPTNKELNYSINIQDYYTRLMSSENEAESMLGAISKIMAGQYYSDLGSIKEGNYMDYSSPTRIWNWEARMEAIIEIYNQNKDLFSQLNNGLVQRLKEILNGNRYLRKKHGDKLERIIGLFT